MYLWRVDRCGFVVVCVHVAVVIAAPTRSLCLQVTTSDRLQRVIRVVLLLGNAVNKSTDKGFALTSLALLEKVSCTSTVRAACTCSRAALTCVYVLGVDV